MTSEVVTTVTNAPNFWVENQAAITLIVVFLSSFVSYFMAQRKNGAKTSAAISNALLLTISSMAVKEKMVEGGEKFAPELKEKMAKEAEKRGLPKELVEYADDVIDKLNDKTLAINVPAGKTNKKVRIGIQDVLDLRNGFRTVRGLLKKIF